MFAVILAIQKIVGLVQIGVTTYQQVHDAVQAGKILATETDGTVITPSQLEARFKAVSDHAAALGAAAGHGIEGRN